MTIDRKALADDLEQLGLKAISTSVRRDTISVERALAAVERLRSRELGRAEARRDARPGSERYGERMRQARIAADARTLLDRYRGSK